MNGKVVITIILMLCVSCKTLKFEAVSGKYVSAGNQFERQAYLTLNTDSTFQYKYGVGGCQYNIHGTYRIANRLIALSNDPEYTIESVQKQISNTLSQDTLNTADSIWAKAIKSIGTPYYPDLSKIAWQIKKNSIRPTIPINLGCFTEEHKYIKQ